MTTLEMNQFDVFYLLYQSDVLEEAQTAFDKLLETIKPLVDDCKLLFTKSLLKVVVLPEPVVAAQLALRLSMQC